MSTAIWCYLVCRFWRGIAWTLAWMFAFWAPALIPVAGWAAPPLLLWAAISERRRTLDRLAGRPHSVTPSR